MGGDAVPFYFSKGAFVKYRERGGGTLLFVDL